MRHPRLLLRGFTTIELMVTVLIIAVLAMAAAPSFASFSANRRIRSTTVELVSDLTLARSESLKRNAQVTIQPATGGWKNGWTIAVAGSGEVLRRRGGIGNSVNLYVSPGALTFDGNGRLSGLAGPAMFGLKGLSANQASFARCVYLDPSGRPHTERAECA